MEEEADVLALAEKLFGFARSGDSTLLDYIDAGVAVDLANHEGNTFLMLAAYSGHAELCQGLLARGANVNALNERGQSILAGAIFKNEMDVVEVLVHAGADPDAGHPTARDCALMFGKQELIDRL